MIQLIHLVNHPILIIKFRTNNIRVMDIFTSKTKLIN